MYERPTKTKETRDEVTTDLGSGEVKLCPTVSASPRHRLSTDEDPLQRGRTALRQPSPGKRMFVVDRNEIDELAWDVVERMRLHLTVAELNAAFIELGVGDPESAIETVLRRMAAKSAALPEDLRTRLRHWVRTYDANPLHAHLGKLLNYAERGDESC